MLKKWFAPHIAVKQSLDNLPSGICFFDENGILMLCNRMMYNIFFEIANTDLRYLEQIEERINPDDYFELANGSVWQFSKTDIVSESGEKYIQYLAFDVTDLYKKRHLLEQENDRLTKMYKMQKALFDNINDIVRDEETLALKIKVHDDLGRAIITMKNCLEDSSTLEDIKSSLRGMRGAFELLSRTSDYDYINTIDSAVESAKQIGVEVIVYGDINSGEFESIMPLAIRECSTNCIRHANGNRLFITVDKNCLRITNNGKPPKHTVTEGGGLQNLRKVCTRNDLNMSVISDGEFQIIIRRNRE